MYLEVVGNILVTEDTHAWIRKTSAKLLDALRKREEKQMFQSCWDFSLLKDKELDVMEGVFARWKSGSEGERSIVLKYANVRSLTPIIVMSPVLTCPQSNHVT